MAAKHLKGIDTTGLRLRVIDAKNQVVGRLAAQIAKVLQGKDKPTYQPNRDDGDVVVVINARHVEFTGRKWDEKLYRWHTGYPGGLKERTAADQFARAPEEILRKAVYGMLPKNLLRKEQSRKLRIFLDENHPFDGHPQLVPMAPTQRTVRVRGEPFVLDEGFEPLNPDAYHMRYGRIIEQQQRKQQEAQAREARLNALKEWKAANGEL